MAIKILPLRFSEGFYATSRCVGETEHFTKRMTDDKEYLESCIEKNLSFLKSIPISVQYWQQRKQDVFTMARQLGKPTMFLTLSASEIRWTHMLQILCKLQRETGVTDPLKELHAIRRSQLVNEDPVTCVIYLNVLVDVIMRVLQHRKRSPFGEHRIVYYFMRKDFQHRGSSHAHLLIWLGNDPLEEISEDMINTVALIDNLCSVSTGNVQNYGN
jgi:hypothetical protein